MDYFTSFVCLVPFMTSCLTKNAQSQVSNAPANNLVAQSAATPKRFRIRVKDLPQPYASESASKNPKIVARPVNAGLKVPPGFRVTVFAQGLSRPRWVYVGPNGDIFVAESYDNRIRLLRDTDADGTAEQNTIFASGLNQPFGMAIAPDGKSFYVANTNAVVQFPYQIGQTRLRGKSRVVTKLTPGGYNQHWTRNLTFSPDGKKLFVSVGSEQNIAEEPLPRASIQVMNPNGSGRKTYASGLRNPVGLDFNPITNQLFTTVNERDKLGDGLVPDYLTSVQAGGFYGYPYSYLGANPDPRMPRRQTLEAKAIVPDVLFQAHSAALGLAFYTGNQFPEEYKNDAFVAFRGSWNRSRATGYKLVRVPFDSKGKAEGYYEDFLTGWVVNPSIPSVWGRPVGLAVGRKGGLLITDESGGKVWRVSYEG